MKCDRCGSMVDLEHAHVLSHLKIVCDECYTDLVENVISLDEWFFDHNGHEG